MPANLAARPLGRRVSRPVRRWLPSGRESLRTKGEEAPASGAIVPAVKDGLLGAVASELGQAPEPPAGTWVSKESAAGTSAPSGVDHGVRTEGVVLVPP